MWRENGNGWIDKGPFEQPKTSAQVTIISRDEQTGKVKLRVKPIHGQKVHYEVGDDPATVASPFLDSDVIEVEGTSYNFVTINTDKIHDIGPPVVFHIPVEIKHRFFRDGDRVKCELKSTPKAQLKYSTDGSDPKSRGGVYHEPFVVPAGAKLIQAAPETAKMWTNRDRSCKTMSWLDVAGRRA